MTIGSLFSGIGGLELGLERAGLGPVLWQAEIDPFCRAVLEKHWPHVTRFSDVREVKRGAAQPVRVVCGGFPCQDLSTANVVNRCGLRGTKSGLWREFDRVVDEFGPDWVIVENTGRNWSAWVPDVRCDLDRYGFASVSIRLSTVDVGANHDRDRVFVVANANRHGKSLRAFNEEASRLSEAARLTGGTWRDPFSGPVRLDDGLSEGMDATRAYGNAVSPVVSEVIGRAVAHAMGER